MIELSVHLHVICIKNNPLTNCACVLAFYFDSFSIAWGACRLEPWLNLLESSQFDFAEDLPLKNYEPTLLRI